MPKINETLRALNPSKVTSSMNGPHPVVNNNSTASGNYASLVGWNIKSVAIFGNFDF